MSRKGEDRKIRHIVLLFFVLLLMIVVFVLVVLGLIPIFSFASLKVNPEMTASWDQGFCQELVIRNESNQVIDGWTIRIANYRLTSMYTKWSADWVQDGGTIRVTPVERNRRLDPGQTWRVGFCVQDGSRRLTNADLTITQGTTTSVSPAPTPQPSPQPLPSPNPNPSPTVPVAGSVVLRFPTDGERPTAKFDANGNGLHDIIFVNNHRNIRSTQGEAVMSYDPSRMILSYTHNLRSIVQKDPGGWVHGYPEVFVGRKPRGGDTTNGWVDLPRRVSDLSSLIFSTDFSITNTSNGPLNMAAEGWIVTDAQRSDNVRGQEIEFMVKLFKENIGAAGSKVDTIVHPVVINGVTTQVTFELFKHTGGWDFFTFIPDRNLDGKKIRTDLKPLLDRLSRHISYSITNYFLMNWEMGTEYGSPQTPNSQISWEMRQFCLSVNGGVQGGFGCESTGMTSPTPPSTQQPTPSNPPVSGSVPGSFSARDLAVIESVVVKLDTIRILQGEDAYNRLVLALRERARTHRVERIRRLISEVLRRSEIE